MSSRPYCCISSTPIVHHDEPRTTVPSYGYPTVTAGQQRARRATKKDTYRVRQLVYSKPFSLTIALLLAEPLRVTSLCAARLLCLTPTAELPPPIAPIRRRPASLRPSHQLTSPSLLTPRAPCRTDTTTHSKSACCSPHSTATPPWHPPCQLQTTPT